MTAFLVAIGVSLLAGGAFCATLIVVATSVQPPHNPANCVSCEKADRPFVDLAERPAAVMAWLHRSVDAADRLNAFADRAQATLVRITIAAAVLLAPLLVWWWLAP